MAVAGAVQDGSGVGEASLPTVAHTGGVGVVTG
jgi:hypothetical protein